MLTVILLSFLSITSALPEFYKFTVWKDKHEKVYETVEEETKRYQIFMDNVKFIQEYNKRLNNTMVLGLNEFSDLTHEEFKKMMSGTMNTTAEWYNEIQEEASMYIEPFGFEVPASIDWRNYGAVTPVKNQGQCGSCYSFSTTGSIEGQWFRAKKKLVSLSEQQIIDCSGSYGNNGCNGGLMTRSFRYIKNNGGIETEQAYPYEAAPSKCRFNSTYVSAKIKSYSTVSPRESSLKSAVASVGPISVGIDATQKSFQHYESGIYYEPNCHPYNINHAVLAVGYGTSSKGKPYWIIKNSWGKTWGEDGYFKLRRNYNNQCGVSSLASYPLV